MFAKAWKGNQGTPAYARALEKEIQVMHAVSACTAPPMFSTTPELAASQQRVRTATALTNLQAATVFAARYALGQGVERETVAAVLADVAHAIRCPGDVAENMGPLTLDDL